MGLLVIKQQPVLSFGTVLPVAVPMHIIGGHYSQISGIVFNANTALANGPAARGHGLTPLMGLLVSIPLSLHLLPTLLKAAAYQV